MPNGSTVDTWFCCSPSVYLTELEEALCRIAASLPFLWVPGLGRESLGKAAGKAMPGRQQNWKEQHRMVHSCRWYFF